MKDHLYAPERLMEQTRKLALEYYETVGQVLPISAELAKYDAIRLLGLKPVEQPLAGVDAYGDRIFQDEPLQIKARVMFRSDASARLGGLTPSGHWTWVLLVLFDGTYHPFEIHAASREEVLHALDQPVSAKRKERGTLSVARFRAIGQMIWNASEGLLLEPS